MPQEFDLGEIEVMDTQNQGNVETEETTTYGSQTKGVRNTVQTSSPTPPNKISVNVIDDRTPILLLFGAPSSGKTMTLVRLAKYLRQKGYSLTVDTNFCTTAWEYEENAKNFNSMLNTTEALSGTGYNDFLFVKISDSRGRPVCQILEGAGEAYFPSNVAYGESRAQQSFPSYMTGIFTGTNKKIWIFLTEPNWKRHIGEKQEYVDRIRYCKGQFFQNKDKGIILYNKVDTTPFVQGSGKVTIGAAMKACNDEYRGIFDIFKNTSALAIFGKKYTCEFVPFSTGVYGAVVPGEPMTYTQSHESYPQVLWEAIIKCIKG